MAFVSDFERTRIHPDTVDNAFDTLYIVQLIALLRRQSLRDFPEFTNLEAMYAVNDSTSGSKRRSSSYRILFRLVADVRFLLGVTAMC